MNDCCKEAVAQAVKDERARAAGIAERFAAGTGCVHGIAPDWKCGECGMGLGVPEPTTPEPE